MGFAVHLWDSEGCLQTLRCSTASSHMCCPGIGLPNSWAPLPALTLAASHVCVGEREREREREREKEREREFTSDPPWISVLWLYLLPGWPRGGVDKVPWKAGPGVLQVQIHDQLWAFQEAVRSGTHLGTWNPGQDQQLIHRQVDLPFSKSLRPAHQTFCCLEGNDSVILCLRSEKADFQCSPISV